MPISGALKVDCAEVFPHGLGVVGEVTPLADFNASTKDNRVQARDKDTGLPMWSVDVLDFDPHAREKTRGRVQAEDQAALFVSARRPGAARPATLAGVEEGRRMIT